MVIAQSGPENAGKTTSIRMLFEKLIDQFPNAKIERLLNKGKDIRAVFMIGAARVGIESQVATLGRGRRGWNRA